MLPGRRIVIHAGCIVRAGSMGRRCQISKKPAAPSKILNVADLAGISLDRGDWRDGRTSSDSEWQFHFDRIRLPHWYERATGSAVWALVRPRVFALYLAFAVLGALLAGYAYALVLTMI